MNKTLCKFTSFSLNTYSGCLYIQSVAITIKVQSSNPVRGEVFSIQHDVIKFVSDLRQASGFLWFPPSIKLTATI